jgi:hypothetical protein
VNPIRLLKNQLPLVGGAGSITKAIVWTSAENVTLRNLQETLLILRISSIRIMALISWFRTLAFPYSALFLFI